MTCSKNSIFAIIATMSGIYPKISLLPVQINNIASFIKNKTSDFQTRFHDEYALLTPARQAVKFENRSGHKAEAYSLSS